MSANTPEQAEPRTSESNTPEPVRVPGLRLVRLDRTTPEVALLREVLPANGSPPNSAGSSTRRCTPCPAPTTTPRGTRSRSSSTTAP